MPGAAASHSAAAQARTGGTFHTHRYRNLFVEDGHSSQEVEAKINAAYAQFFHGDPETQAVFFKAGKNGQGPLAYVTDWANHDVRSEGMSYGMMLAVQLDHKEDFDALWNWAKTYMYVADPKAPGYQFFAWSCKLDGTRNEQTSAPDGEEYFAMALYFAGARWGNGSGIFDYHAEADRLLTAMRHREEIDGETPQGFRHVSSEVDEAHRMIRFTPSDGGSGFTDPSYQLPGFYELWARWGPAQDRVFWAEAARASRNFFVSTVDPRTGLAPAYANFDGTPHQTNFGQSTIFGFDSWRTASNWSFDWNWFRADPASRCLPTASRPSSPPRARTTPPSTPSAASRSDRTTLSLRQRTARAQSRRRQLRRQPRLNLAKGTIMPPTSTTPPDWSPPMPSPLSLPRTAFAPASSPRPCGICLYRPGSSATTTACSTC